MASSIEASVGLSFNSASNFFEFLTAFSLISLFLSNSALHGFGSSIFFPSSVSPSFFSSSL
jgi:hypothetical protein